MSHFISLDKAKQMTKLYRENKESILSEKFKGQNILAKCESFDRSAFDAVLSQSGCVGLRIYYGMDETMKVHAIVVGVNEKDEDMIPNTLMAKTDGGDDGDGLIIEESMRCPEVCPPESELNTP